MCERKTKQLSTQNISTTITLASVTTLRDLQDPHDPAAQPVQRPAGAAHGKRRRLHDSPPQIAGRRRSELLAVRVLSSALAFTGVRSRACPAPCSMRYFVAVPWCSVVPLSAFKIKKLKMDG